MSVSASVSLLPQEVWASNVTSPPASGGDWLLPGFISRGNATLLTSMWKSGKTTLLTHLLARRIAGGTFLGREIAPGKSVVISEEPLSLWADRCRRFNYGSTLCLFPQPFPHLPSAEQWRGLLERVGQLHAEHGVDLLVIDSVTHFLRSETASRGVLDLLMPVQALTARGMSALLMHHPRRQDASPGNAGRGHGALHSEVAISIEMRHAGANLDSRARRFFCLSRFPETPRHFGFELNADASDYTVLPLTEDDGFQEQWDVLRMVLEDAEKKLTRRDILGEWPQDFDKPSDATLWRWLNTAVAAGMVQVEGTGRKADPFHYWLPAALARWRENPLYELFEQQRRDVKLTLQSLGERKRAAVASRVYPEGV